VQHSRALQRTLAAPFIASSCLRSHGRDSVAVSGRIPFSYPSITRVTMFESGMTWIDL
jgi:hypothetical protein